MKCPLTDKGCGGCSGLETMYGTLLRDKEAEFRQLFPRSLPIIGMEDPRHYRNKVLRSFANGRSGLYCGMYRTHTHQILSVRSCFLENRRANEIAQIALQILSDMEIPAYREDFHRGVLRHLLIRRGFRSGQALVTLVTGSAEFPEGKDFAKRLMAQCPEIQGVIQNINDRTGSAVLGFQNRLLAGRDLLWDEINGLRVCLSAQSFYQINTVQAEKLYALALTMASLTAEDTVLDAYCGVGMLGMLAARRASHVTGVEISRPSIECAQRAARVNHLSNIDFYCGDTVHFMEKHATLHPSVVFLDPPRNGCAERFLHAIAQCAPSRIVYISCCPQTLKRDVDFLQACGYSLQQTQPFDLFPYTKHIEAACLLTKLK